MPPGGGVSLQSISCLKPHYSLRKQLLLSFGISAFVTISLVLTVACTSADMARNVVKHRANTLLTNQVMETLVDLTRHLGEQISGYIEHVQGTVQLLAEVTQDRIVGYPTLLQQQKWQTDDDFVPFADLYTKRRQYPWHQGPLPLDWDITRDDNNNNNNRSAENYPNRPWMIPPAKEFPRLMTTATASFHMQGTCDPAATSTDATYRPNCTAANNDMATGGAIQTIASNTTLYLHRASADIAVVMKALWEVESGLSHMFVHYVNDGAGATVLFPGTVRHAQASPYPSDGCEWLVTTINPLTGRALGTREQASKCRPEGVPVMQRDFNPLEMDTCRVFVEAFISSYNASSMRAQQQQRRRHLQSTEPNTVVPPKNLTITPSFYGPFLSYASDIPVLAVGKPVFDRLTHEFIGCVGADLALVDLNDQMKRANLQQDRSYVALVRYDNGKIIADTAGSLVLSTESLVHTGHVHYHDDDTDQAASMYVYNTTFITQKSVFLQLKNAVDFENPWTPEDLQAALAANIVRQENGGIVTSYPLPVPPLDRYDPEYRPQFLLIHVVNNDVFESIRDMDEQIKHDVRDISVVSVVIGFVGLLLVLSLVGCVSQILTQPLLWMESVAYRIVNHAATEDQLCQKRQQQQQEQKQEQDKVAEKIITEEKKDAAEDEEIFAPKPERISVIMEEESSDHDEEDSDALQQQQQSEHETASVPTQPQHCTINITELGDDDPTPCYLRTMGYLHPHNNNSNEHNVPNLCRRLTEYCTPKRTEITDLVSEFRRMIRGFSGDGASNVAEAAFNEIPNQLTWQSEFRQLYYLISERQSSSDSAMPPSSLPNMSSLNHIPFDSEEFYRYEQPVSNNSRQQSSPHAVESGPVSRSMARLELPLTENKDDCDISVEWENLAPENSQAVASGETLTDPTTIASDEQQQITLHRNQQPLRGQEPMPPIPTTRHQAVAGSRDSTIMTHIFPAPLKCNRGHNVRPNDNERRIPTQMSRAAIRPHRASLFWWILILMVLPLLLTNIVICAVVAGNILTVIPSWVRTTEDASHALQIDALATIAASKALLAGTMLYEPLRDLFLMTRVAGWLHYGAIHRSDIFTEEYDSTELCKSYPRDLSCPFYKSYEGQCDCAWDDPSEVPCKSEFNVTDTRYLQKMFFAVQARDNDPITGDRYSASSFPMYDTSPETTLWWNETTQMPGAWKGENVSGYQTMYDRVRVSSAMSVVDFPVYNYATALRRKKNVLGQYLAFDADGMMTGFTGCDYSNSRWASFQSTEKNGAAELAPELCPLGKYGYDPRCRQWYQSGKQAYTDKREAAFITPPYLFASTNDVATSATAAVANPSTKEFLGMVLIDFYPSDILDTLSELRGMLSFVITPQEDVLGADTVIGPNKTIGWKSSPISDLLFPWDDEEALNRREFEQNILRQMKAGAHGIGHFQRTEGNGQVTKMTIAYEPVYAPMLLPVDPGDFSRGVLFSQKLVYSVGIASSEEEIRRPFVTIESDVSREVGRLVFIYFLLVVAISITFTTFNFWTTIMVTRPMITILRVVQEINAGKLQDDIPPLQEGSREVNRVYNSFAKLYKIVRISNIAFFSGNMEWAYHFINDALKLFRKINDQKAIGIACNNLGNTIFALCHAKSNRKKGDTVGVSEGFESAIRYYDEGIEIAQRVFDEESIDEDKAFFAKQLADRLFNRALFLLFMQSQPGSPSNARERAFADISRTKELDGDVRDFWLEKKLLLQNTTSYFCGLIRRIHGLVDFYHDEDLRKLWDAKSLVDEADQLLFTAWNEPSAPIFEELSRVGRLQQLEGAVIRLELCQGNVIEAARLAMRMFAEDEYLLESVFQHSGNALLSIVKSFDMKEKPATSSRRILCWSQKTRSSVRADLRHMLRVCKNTSLDLGKCFVFALEVSEIWEESEIFGKVHSRSLELYDDSFSQEDFMGLVAYTKQGNLTIELGKKRDHVARQREMLCLATSTTSERANPAFPVAVQMLIDNAATLEKDSFIVLVTDGYAWDSEPYGSIKWQIERLNRERKFLIHVIILGLEVEDDAIIEQCRQMCTVSKISFYTDVTEENIDATYDMIDNLISGKSTTNNALLQSITMEKF